MRYASSLPPSSLNRTVLPMLTTPELLAVSIRTWFLTIASRSLIRASIIPCSFLAAWYSKFSERSPNSRAALILATMAGRRTVTSWSSSWRTVSSPSGVMWTSFVTRSSLDARTSAWSPGVAYLGAARIQSPHEKALAYGGHGPDGSVFGGRIGEGSVRQRTAAPRSPDRDKLFRRRGGAGYRSDGRCDPSGGQHRLGACRHPVRALSLIHISEPTRQAEISYAVFCL